MPLHVDPVRCEHDDDVRVSGVEASAELEHGGLGRRCEARALRRARGRDREVAVRRDARKHQPTLPGLARTAV
jgi:hypothetical protein